MDTRPRSDVISCPATGSGTEPGPVAQTPTTGSVMQTPTRRRVRRHAPGATDGRAAPAPHRPGAGRHQRSRGPAGRIDVPEGPVGERPAASSRHAHDARQGTHPEPTPRGLTRGAVLWWSLVAVACLALAWPVGPGGVRLALTTVAMVIVVMLNLRLDPAVTAGQPTARAATRTLERR